VTAEPGLVLYRAALAWRASRDTWRAMPAPDLEGLGPGERSQARREHQAPVLDAAWNLAAVVREHGTGTWAAGLARPAPGTGRTTYWVHRNDAGSLLEAQITADSIRPTA
jgi:hypothetical protein